MDEITLAKRQVQLSSWKAMVETRQASGLTIPVWCRENGITESAYYYRLRQVRTAFLDAIPAGSLSSSGSSSLSFCKVEIEDPKPAALSCSVVVHLSGADIDIRPGVDHASLTAVFRALRESC